MIYNIITSTPNVFNYLLQEKIIKDAINIGLVKINIWNIKFKKKTKIQK